MDIMAPIPQRGHKIHGSQEKHLEQPTFQPGQAFNDTYVGPGQLAGARSYRLYRLGLNGVRGLDSRPGYWMLSIVTGDDDVQPVSIYL